MGSAPWLRSHDACARARVEDRRESHKRLYHHFLKESILNEGMNEGNVAGLLRSS